MRSGYESFLRRQLLKPRAAAPRWLDTRPAPPTAPAPLQPPEAASPAPVEPGEALQAEDNARLIAAQLRATEPVDETMPAILWRDSQVPAVTAAGATTEAADEPVLAGSSSATDATASQTSHTTPDARPRRAAASVEQLDRLIDTTLADARQHNRLGALLRIDVARLDDIGDAWGEAAVGHVLRALHHRLSRLLAQVAPQARALALGDALWVVLPQLGRSSVAEALTRQMLEALTRPLTLRDHAISLHGSAGLAVLPHDGIEPAVLRRAAEVAARQARSQGRGAYRFYAREIETRAQRRLALEARLRSALTHDELHLAFQPRAEVRSGALAAADVLPAWLPADQPGWRGSELLLLAEETGLAESLAHWTVRTACQHLRRWLDSGLAMPQLSLPMLLSPFRRADFVDRLVDQVRSHRIDPARLTLLLSPSAPSSAGTAAHGVAGATMAVSPASGGFDLSQGAARLQPCRDAGFRLAMDGAATSSCSLATLRQLPLSEMRLDGRLVASTDHADQGFAAAIVALGQRLGLRMVAGDITDEAQLDRLAALGCDEFQGPLLSDPLDAQTWSEVVAGAGSSRN